MSYSGWYTEVMERRREPHPYSEVSLFQPLQEALNQQMEENLTTCAHGGLIVTVPWRIRIWWRIRRWWRRHVLRRPRGPFDLIITQREGGPPKVSACFNPYMGEGTCSSTPNESGTPGSSSNETD